MQRKVMFIVSGSPGDQFVTVIIEGERPLVAHSSHPNFDRIVEGARNGDNSVSELFDVAESITSRFERLTERITTANGALYLDGVLMNDALATQAVAFMRDGVEDFWPLLYFYEKVQQNPQEHSREQFYPWLTNHDFTIDDNGDVIGYKGVEKVDDANFLSIHSGRAIVNDQIVSGRIPQALGDIVEMPRDEVAFDPSNGCSSGLHVANFDFAKSYNHGAILDVRFSPRDVVSVPTDSGWSKVRVCRYYIHSEVEQEYSTPYLASYSTPDEEYDGDFWGDGEGEYDLEENIYHLEDYEY